MHCGGLGVYLAGAPGAGGFRVWLEEKLGPEKRGGLKYV